jgi:hypothetical protein
MDRKMKHRILFSAVVATVAAVPAGFAGYILGYHSSLPIFGGGPFAILIPFLIVWGSVFLIGGLRALFLFRYPEIK